MGIKAVIMVTLGLIFTIIGAVGLVIPVWPTTPFLIVATGCFSATPQIQERMLKIPLFGDHIRNYKSRTGLSEKSVLISLGFLWSMLGISCLIVKTVWIVVLLAVIGILVTVHIVWMARAKR